MLCCFWFFASIVYRERVCVGIPLSSDGFHPAIEMVRLPRMGDVHLLGMDPGDVPGRAGWGLLRAKVGFNVGVVAQYKFESSQSSR